jgi:prolyl-tRNA synthetase
MLFSNLFCPILKDSPKEAQIVSHKLMLQSGLIRQTASGIYVFLPLGLKILNKITAIIKAEIDNTGANHLLMPTIQNADIWQQSGRYDGYGQEMLRITDRHNRDMLFSPTNEEQITQIFKENVQSYKDLPLNLYQINWKFRDEIRPRFGVMRGREFLMKDAYSFDLTIENATISYKKMFSSYLKIFETLGLKALPMKADTGPIGGDLSHEFLILATTGESTVYCDKRILDLTLANKKINYNSVDIENIYDQYTSFYSATDEKHSENDELYNNNKEHVIQQKAIEVGHIFYFADKYSKAMDAKILSKDGSQINPLMGSYGIGVSRLMAAIIEANFDDKGIIWTPATSPFDCIISSLGNNPEVTAECDKIYEYLKQNNIDVLYNNKDDNVGTKLNTADLLGITYQINIGAKSLKNGVLEFKHRKSGKIEELDIANLSQIKEKLCLIK